MKKATWVLFTGLLIGISGCLNERKKDINNRADLIAYINDPVNGIQKKDSVGKMEAVLSYRPWQMAAFNRSDLGPNDKSAKSVLAKDKWCFVLSLSANHKELLKQLNFNQYSELVQVFAFRMSEFIKAYPDNGEPVEPLDCLYQQTYGMGIANNLLIVFDRKKLMNANSLHIQVKEFGLNTGDLNFKMNTEDIKSIPVTGLK